MLAAGLAPSRLQKAVRAKARGRPAGRWPYKQKYASTPQAQTSTFSVALPRHTSGAMYCGVPTGENLELPSSLTATGWRWRTSSFLIGAGRAPSRAPATSSKGTCHAQLSSCPRDVVQRCSKWRASSTSGVHLTLRWKKACKCFSSTFLPNTLICLQHA